VGGKGSGIGAGPPGYGVSRVENITITDSKITANSDFNASVIGSGGSGSDVRLLTFSGSCFVECKGDSSRTVPSINASSVVFSDGSSLKFIADVITDNTRLFGPSPSNEGEFDLVIGYHQATKVENENLSQLNTSFLRLSDVPDSGAKINDVCAAKTGFSRCFNETEHVIKSLIVKYVELSPTQHISASLALNSTALKPSAIADGDWPSTPPYRSGDLLDSGKFGAANVAVSDGVTVTDRFSGSDETSVASRIVPSSFIGRSYLVQSWVIRLSNGIDDSVAAHGVKRSDDLTISVGLTGSEDPFSLGLGSSVQIGPSAGVVGSVVQFTGIVLQSDQSEPSLFGIGSLYSISHGLSSSAQVGGSAGLVASCLKFSGNLSPSGRGGQSVISLGSQFSISVGIPSSAQIGASPDIARSVVQFSEILARSSEGEPSTYEGRESEDLTESVGVGSVYPVSVGLGASGQIDASVHGDDSVVRLSGILLASEQRGPTALRIRSADSISLALDSWAEGDDSAGFAHSIVTLSGILEESGEGEASAFGIRSARRPVSDGFDSLIVRGETDIPASSEPRKKSLVVAATYRHIGSVLFSFSATLERPASYEPFIGGADGAQLGTANGGGAAVGATVGTVLGVLMALVIAIFLFWKRRSRQEPVGQANATDGESQDSFTGDDDVYMSEENTLHEDDFLDSELLYSERSDE
jgi:hypothetical protein